MTSIKPKTYRYFADLAYINYRWSNDVVIEVSDGVISLVEVGADSADCRRLNGPVLPAIANLHSHAFQYLMAGMAEVSINPADSFWSWRDLMYKTVSRLTPDEIQVVATQLYIDMLKAGYTQVGEFQYLFNNTDGRQYQHSTEISAQLIRAAELSGIGITLLPALYSHSGFGGQTAADGQKRFLNTSESYLEHHQNVAKIIGDHQRHKLGLCFHSLRAVTQQQMKEVLGSSAGLPIHLHIAEQRKEVYDCIGWSGQRPVEWLFNNFEVDSNWCLIHATHIDNNEQAAIVRSGAVVGLCPTTEANLGDGIFPATEFVQQGGKWGIGSDSHVTLSIKDELRALEYSQRLNDQQRNRLRDRAHSSIGDYLYKQAHLGGNQALSTEIGLSIGQRADFLVLDVNHPFIGSRPKESILNSWLFASNDNIVKDVYVAGELIVDSFHHPLEEQSQEMFGNLMKKVFCDA